MAGPRVCDREGAAPERHKGSERGKKKLSKGRSARPNVSNILVGHDRSYTGRPRLPRVGGER